MRRAEGKLERWRQGALRVIREPAEGPLSAIALAVRAGSRFDGRHPGLAHMAEHMLFQGTRSIDQATLNRRAGELGGEHDADTGYEDIALHFEVFNEDVPEALALLAEQCFASSMDAERFAKEQRVVVDEIRGRMEDPASYLHERAWSGFFAGSLGHPVCGTIGSVSALAPRHVRRFVARHFTPAGMVLAVVGGIDRRRLRHAVARAFRGAPPGRPFAPPPVRPGRRGRLYLRRRNLPQTYLAHLVPAPAGFPRVVALSLAVEIVGADPDALLFQEIRERLGLGYEVGASVEHGDGWAAVVLAASAARGDGRRLRATLLGTCREAAARGFSNEEVARAKKKVRFRFARLADSRLERALAHASRLLCGQPSLRVAERMVEDTPREAVVAAWREVMAVPALSAFLSA